MLSEGRSALETRGLDMKILVTGDAGYIGNVVTE
jgi:hypothetical protein